MVLRTLDSMGPQHGFGLAKRIQQISDGALDLNQGTLYPALLRLEHRGWIKSKWGASGQQPQGQVLRDHHAPDESTDCAGIRGVGAHRRHHGALHAPRRSTDTCMGGFWNRITELFRRNRLDRRLDRRVGHPSLAGWREFRAERHERRRMPGAAARREFGGVAHAKEDLPTGTRHASGGELRPKDIRYALRQDCDRNPGLTAAAVLSLALGIGANTAVFSLFHAVMLRSLPVGEPGATW